MQQRRGLGQPGRRAVGVTGGQALLGQILQRGNGDFRGAVPLGHLEGLLVLVECFRPGTEVAQHPAGEVHRAAGEPRHLAPLHLGGIPAERGQRQRRPSHGVRVPGEQQRVQRGRRVLGADLPAGGRAEQRKRLLGPALMRAQHAQPGGRGHPVRALGQRHRLAQQQLRLVQVAGRVVDAAAGGQAASPVGRPVAASAPSSANWAACAKRRPK